MAGGTGHDTQSRAVRCAHGRTSYRNPAARALINPPTPVPATAKAQGAPGTPPPPDCNNTPISPTRASDGYFVRAPSDNLQHKTWQPRGGDIPFTVHLTQNFDNDSAV